MKSPIVSISEPILLVGGGTVCDEMIRDLSAHGRHWIGVDGGADQLLARDLHPEAVIGDLDSLSAAARAAFSDRLHRIAEQDSTDFDKALRSVAAPLVLGAGFLGGRLDHSLAALNVLARYRRRCILLDEEDLVFQCPPDLALDLPCGTGIGLFPMAPCQIASEGLRWPTDGIDFAPAGRIGSSNETSAPRQILRPSGPALLITLPRAMLARAIAGLSNSEY